MTLWKRPTPIPGALFGVFPRRVVDNLPPGTVAIFGYPDGKGGFKPGYVEVRDSQEPKPVPTPPQGGVEG